MKKTQKTVYYTILILFAMISLYPVVWSVFASFHSDPDILKGEVILTPYTIKNYTEILFDNPMFIRWVLNSVLIAVVGTIVTVTANTMVGYALARINFRFKKVVMLMVLIVMVMPMQALMIPNYVLVNKLGLLNTYFAFWLPTLVNAMYIFMMCQFFKNLPIEVEEAAYIDGLGRWGILYKVAAPMAKPAVMTQTIFIFMGYWNIFQQSILYMQDRSMFSLQHGLQTFQSANTTSWGIVIAGSLISMLPILIIYIFANKQFVTGMSFGGGK